MPRFCWESLGKTHSKGTGHLGKMSQVESWAGLGGGGNQTGAAAGKTGKGGSGPRADKDVFSSLKFDFHDLFAAGYRSPRATPSTDWGRLCFPC